MSARSKDYQSSILILADFSDGSWSAASFAMQFLYTEEAVLTILQTYQNPGWGHFMMRKLSHHLKRITKNELRALKVKLLNHFEIEKDKINTLSVEGDLYSVLNYKPIINSRYSMVLSTLNSFDDSCKRQNGYLERIVDTAPNPLFVLPGTFYGETGKKILFVGNSESNPSEQLCNQVIDICKKTQSGLEILFVLKNQAQKIPEHVQLCYNNYFKEIDTTVTTIHNKTKCKGINKYLGQTTRDLIVIDND